MSAPGNVRRAGAAVTRTDWRTPKYVFRHFDAHYHFDLDAAASAENALCPVYLDMEFDALKTPWNRRKGVKRNGRAWCNPPYGRGLQQWADRFALESNAGWTIVALVPVATETNWWRTMWETASLVEFLDHRIGFINPVSGLPVKDNTSSSAFFHFFPHPYRISASPVVRNLYIPRPSREV